MQTDIFEVHKHEDSAESQSILDGNRDLFSADVRKVYDLLMGMGQHTVREMDVDRARLSDLKRLGFRFSFVLNKNRYKAWYSSPEDKAHNKVNYEKLKSEL